MYDTIEVTGARSGDGVELDFRGTARTFIGVVSVYGAKGANVNTQLLSASRLTAGTRFTEARLDHALQVMRQILAQNGFYAPTITQKLTRHADQQLVDIDLDVNSGVQARVGTVTVTGDSGMSSETFRRYAHLRTGAHVDHDTGNRALAGVLKHYRGEQRLQAEIKLEGEQFDAGTQRVNFKFSVSRGPVIKVEVGGASLSEERVRRLIPIFEEGAVDDDLLNEGNRRLRDYYQRLGYFDVKVQHELKNANADLVVVVYRINLGARRRVARVSLAGNHYFDTDTLMDLLSVHAADVLDRHGVYSQALVAADVSALEGVYQDNGFQQVKVTPETSTPETMSADETNIQTQAAKTEAGTAPLSVVYHINEGPQERVGAVEIEGNNHIEVAQLTPLMNTIAGQLYSPGNLARDRDALLTIYLAHGFAQVHVDVTEQKEAKDAEMTDVAFHITEGPQTFVRDVVLSGLYYTRPDTVKRAITLHPGDPLNETALTDTERNLYEYGLFNEVQAAVENPAGAATNKTVLL
ncbi:MAG: POTRA domain-containing protein, partial [Alphaproteobacteria bacterium]